MIKSLLLIFDSANTWEKIAAAPQSVLKVITLSLMPLLLLSAAVEGAALIKFGREQGPLDTMKPVSQGLVLRYEIAQLGLSLLVVVAGAAVLQKIGQSFHRRHTYAECFTTLAYSLSPLFLLRVFAGLPAIHTWASWAVGILLSVSALYRGIPRIMRPDPSNALGLYLLSSLLLIVVTGLAHFVAGMVLNEKILAGTWGF